MALRSYLDGKLLAEVYGTPPPRILALHGWGRRGNDFAKSLGALSTIAPDLPGFGATPPPGEAIGAQGYADSIAGLLEEFDVPPVVVGHSFGGRVALCLAATHPRLVGSVVLTGVPLVRLAPRRGPSWGYRLARMANRAGLYPDDRMERLRHRRGSADYQAATGVMRDVLVKVVNETYEDQLRSIDMPVHLLWGADDGEVPVAVAHTAARLLADSDLRVLPGVGHFVPSEAPEELRATVEGTLQ